MAAPQIATVRGTNYKIFDIPPRKALRLGMALGGRVQIVPEKKSAESEPSAPDPAAKPAEPPKQVIDYDLTAKLLLIASDDAEPDTTVLDLLSCVLAPGAGLVTEKNFDVAFSDGRIADIPELLALVLERNFADFFSGLVASSPE